MYKVIMCRQVVPESGIFSPVPPVTKPDFPEGRFPGRTFDEAQLGCVAMVRASQALTVFSHRGGTSLPPPISPQPADPQHVPGAF